MHLEATVRIPEDGKQVCRTVKTDISSRRQAERALMENEETHRSILLASPDTITITDLDGRILMVSPSALLLLGCRTEGEVLGQFMTVFLVPEDRVRFHQNITLLIQGVVAGPVEYRGLCPDDCSYDMEMNVELLRGSDRLPKKIVFICAFGRDQRHSGLFEAGNWNLHRPKKPFAP